MPPPQEPHDHSQAINQVWNANDIPERGPRPVYIRYAQRVMCTIAIFITLMIVAVGLPWMQKNLAQTERFIREGRTVSGVISSIMSRGSEKYPLTVTYYHDGRPYTKKFFPGREEYARRCPGDIVPITYLPASPEESRYGTVSWETFHEERLLWSLWLIGLTGGFTLLLGYLKIQERNEAVVARDWVRLGAEATAVRSLEEKDKLFRWEINYRVHYPDGRIEEDNLYVYSSGVEKEAPVQPGQPFVVFMDPLNHGHMKTQWDLSCVTLFPEHPNEKAREVPS